MGEPRRARLLNSVIPSSEPGPVPLVEDMRSFLGQEEWYADRGIPYRRGYLLHGPPGCGKTTLVTAAAAELELPVFILNLAEPCLTDLGLLKLATDAHPRGILLMEDVDVAFSAFRSAEDSGSKMRGKNTGLLTFSGLLNALDGVAGQEGKIVMMTTNHVDALDAALVRPGRADVRVAFRHVDREGIANSFTKFFRGSPISDAEMQKAAVAFAAKCPDKQLSMAVVQGHLMRFRDDPLGAAAADPPLPTESITRQFHVPPGMGMAFDGEDEEEEEE